MKHLAIAAAALLLAQAPAGATPMRIHYTAGKKGIQVHDNKSAAS